ncbi:hypothetical protein [Kitasatospora sp. NPDC057198]|uniref:hypothetical protein n=1 Tax=Kitasatospora sp. NPDC057198 TaxID=3346046 RepID=UPI003642DF3C
MSDQQTAREILDALSPEARKLVGRVFELERQYLHVKNPSMLTDEIVRAAKELAK